jgi:hypothetical protein
MAGLKYLPPRNIMTPTAKLMIPARRKLRKAILSLDIDNAGVVNFAFQIKP